MSKDIFIDAGSLVVLSGLPGSGKSSLKASAQGFRDLQQAWLSADELRMKLFAPYQEMDDDSGSHFVFISQEGNSAVFSILHSILHVRLGQRQTCIVDATNINDGERRSYIAIAKELGVPYKVLILDTPLEECLRANALRNHRVAEHRIREMHTPRSAADTVKADGSTVPKTPPTGFMLTSEFPYEIISRGDRLVLRQPQLQGEHYDILGDTHGLLADTLALLAKAGWEYRDDGRLSHPEGRKLLCLGDFVDRGPDSLALIRLMRKAVKDGVAEVLLGNHESKLVRFVDTYSGEGKSEWGSLSNAETGVALLKQPDCDELVAFLRSLPHYKLLSTADGYNIAFVHGNMKRFDAELSLAGDCIYGQTGWERGVDSDAMYQARYQDGINQWTMVRGHIPQTSEQEQIFSLERECYQQGEIVLLQLDAMLEKSRAGSTMRQAFEQSVLTQRCEFDYQASCAKWDLRKGMQTLVAQKHATVQFSDDKLLRVYKYSKQTFWNNSWGESPWLTKARGLVLDVAGNIVSHPFDKVFNLHENGAGDDLPEDEKVIVVEKLNGFLGVVSAHPVKRGRLVAHTQGGFGGKFVDYINEYLQQPAIRGRVCHFLGHNDVTLMFEVLHPEDPHIIAYEPEMMGLHLIGVRGKSLQDPLWTEEQIDTAAQSMGLRRPSWKRYPWSYVKTVLPEMRTEGVMVRRDDETQETLFKAKTPYYLVNKFLGRMGVKKITHMYASPNDFKKTVDEEFYPLVDRLVAKVPRDDFAVMSNESRVKVVRELLNELF